MHNANSKRLFVALELSPALKESLLAIQPQAGAGAVWAGAC